jgi:hypothetical protein
VVGGLTIDQIARTGQKLTAAIRRAAARGL